MEGKEAKAIIEALLFISGQPLSMAEIKRILELGEAEIKGLLEEFRTEYDMRGSGLQVAEVAQGYQIVTRQQYAPWVRKLANITVSAKLSQAALETLAIVAYKQPAIKAEIEAIRGVNSDGVMKTLLERSLIKILGRREMPGRPLMYGTTKEFLQYFGLKDLSDLPTLKEFDDVEKVAS